MASKSDLLVTKAASGSPYQLEPQQVLRASTALLRKIQTDEAAEKEIAKPTLLDDADGDGNGDETPLWLILTTKKHIIDKKRLKPGKISLPHPYLSASQENLRICLITADPQRKYKELIAEQSFPLEVGKLISRVIGMEKLKTKYKSYESRRQLFSEHDVFLADDRIVTYLPQVLGKVFYKSGSKRPIPVNLEGKRQSVDEQGNKRQKLSEGGSKVIKHDVTTQDASREITRTLGSALVHLAPSTTTAVKVGVASQSPEQVQENIEAVVAAMIEKYVPQQWKNVRAVHVKGPNTIALPIWLADELWTDEQDVLDEAPKANEGKKRTRSALAQSGEGSGAAADVIEVPGPDGKIRRLEKPSSKRKGKDGEPESGAISSKKRKNSSSGETTTAAVAKETEKVERAEKTARKEALKKQKDAVRPDSNGSAKAKKSGKKT